MITVEYEFEETIVTIMDPDGRFEDLQLILRQDTFCYVRQWDESTGCFQVIQCSPQMIDLMMQSYHLQEGTYVVEGKNPVWK
jgi:hypothetical protein